jgi:hypothetical protein
VGIVVGVQKLWQALAEGLVVIETPFEPKVFFSREEPAQDNGLWTQSMPMTLRWYVLHPSQIHCAS